MAVQLKGSGDANSANAVMARSMGLAPQKLGGSGGAGQSSSSAPPPQMPTPKAIEMGLPSAMAALAKLQGKGKEQETDVDPAAIKSKDNKKVDEDSDQEDEHAGDDEISKIRNKRIEELKQAQIKQKEWLANGHGTYTEVTSDEFLPAVTKSKFAVCHFYHPNFERCRIVDKHMAALAPQHMPCRFIKINADKSPFFVQKLAIKVLPTVVFFKDGKTNERMVGFEDVGGVDDFTTQTFAKRLAKAGVILLRETKPAPTSAVLRTSLASKPLDSDEDDGDD